MKKRKITKVNWANSVPTITAVIAIILSTWALIESIKSNRLASESNEIANAAQSANETEIARQHASNISTTYHVAKSPDLRAEQDTEWIYKNNLVPMIARSQFWSKEMEQYKSSPKNGYIFIFITNYGPGVLRNVTITDIKWIPKKDEQIPTGILVNYPLNVLPNGALYAFLIDTISDKDVDISNRNFDKFKFKLLAEDEAGNQKEYILEINFHSDPVEATPVNEDQFSPPEPTREIETPLP